MGGGSGESCFDSWEYLCSVLLLPHMWREGQVPGDTQINTHGRIGWLGREMTDGFRKRNTGEEVSPERKNRMLVSAFCCVPSL